VTRPPEREVGRELAGALHHSTGSYELVVGAIAAALLGLWIDSVLGLVPIFTLIFAISGFIGASYSIWLNYQAKMVDEEALRLDRRNGSTASTAQQTVDPVA